ncbi:MAG: cell division protein FtsB [Pseudomonadota bacterium]
MRGLGLLLALLILLLQYPLWLGKGSWLKVWELERQVEQQKTANEALAVRNAKLAAEVNDLKQGFDAIEERARFELGMIKRNEVFFQVVEPPGGETSVKTNQSDAAGAAAPPGATQP